MDRSFVEVVRIVEVDKNRGNKEDKNRKENDVEVFVLVFEIILHFKVLYKKVFITLINVKEEVV